MGEMADFINEQEPENDYEPPTQSPGITCRACGRKNLHWQQMRGRWLLFDNRGLHICKVAPLNPASL